jgi:two-component system nitrogen regulation response regulator GlnG
MAPGQTVEAKDLPQDLTEGRDFAAPVPAATQSGRPAYQIDPDAERPAFNGSTASSPSQAEGASWISLLEAEAAALLAAGQPEVMDALGRQFESILIKTALKHTHGRKNDAAIRLGIGRNTITRKIHELGIDGAKDE